MRLFVHFDRKGTILSASKIEVMSPEIDHPYGVLQQGEDVLEVTPTAVLGALDVHELPSRYLVDVQKRRLRKRPA